MSAPVPNPAPESSPILAMRAAIVAKLRERFPDTNIEEHKRTTFGAQDLSLTLKDRSIAVRVAFSGVPEESKWSSNEVDFPAAWSVYLCTKDISGKHPLPRDVIALRFLPALLLAVSPGTWAVDFDHGDLKKLRSASLFEGEAEGKSALVWGVSWLQSITYSDEAALADLRPFLTLLTKYDLAPSPDGVFEANETIRMGHPT